MTIDRHGVNDGHGPSAEARGEQPLTADGQDGRYRYEGKQHLSYRTLPVRCYRTTDSNRVSASRFCPWPLAPQRLSASAARRLCQRHVNCSRNGLPKFVSLIWSNVFRLEESFSTRLLTCTLDRCSLVMFRCSSWRTE